MNKLFITSLIFLNSFFLFSQDDSLNGFGDFTFGMSKSEVQTILTNNQISFSNIWPFYYPLFCDNHLCYEEDVIIMPRRFHHYVLLTFNDNNQFIYSHVIFSDTVSFFIYETLVESGFEKIMGVMTEKYGTNYEMIDYSDSLNTMIGKRKIYNWNKLNGSIHLTYDFSTFFVRDRFKFEFTNEHNDEGEYFISISYTSADLWDKHRKAKLKEQDDKTKSKF